MPPSHAHRPRRQYGLLLLSPSPLPAKRWVHVAVTVLTDDSASACEAPIQYSTQQPERASRLCTDPVEARLYIDGEQVDADVWGDGHRNLLDENGHRLRIGLYDNTDYDKQWWNGYLDEIRIWSTVRTQRQLADFAYLSRLADDDADGLLLYYQFDSPKSFKNASLVVDSSSSGYDGIVQFDGPVGPVYYVNASICAGDALTTARDGDDDEAAARR